MMEGAQAPIISALFVQGDILAHHVHNVEAGIEFFQKLFRDRHARTSILASLQVFYVI